MAIDSGNPTALRFGRWYIVNRRDPTLAWAGSHWAPHAGGIPTGDYQICNFDTEAETQEYIDSLAGSPPAATTA